LVFAAVEIARPPFVKFRMSLFSAASLLPHIGTKR
jgi:hypothetical protein